jgi:predicted anti-sigma-YlaC factor YlaD
MGMRWWKTNACERATQWISLDLDGELSPLEQAALVRHLEGCAPCRSISTDVRSFTELLRAQPLAELGRPLAAPLPGRARVRAARRVTVALAFAGLMAATTFGGLALTGPGSSAQSALAFRSLQEQKRFAEHETLRLEPAHEIALSDTRCIGNCALG